VVVQASIDPEAVPPIDGLAVAVEAAQRLRRARDSEERNESDQQERSVASHDEAR